MALENQQPDPNIPETPQMPEGVEPILGAILETANHDADITHELLENIIEQGDSVEPLLENVVEGQGQILEELQKPKPEVQKVQLLGAELLTIKGEKGDKGDPGYTPEKGKDYFTQDDITKVSEVVQKLIRVPEDGYTPEAGKDYFTEQDIRNFIAVVLDKIPRPKDGEDGVVDYELAAQETMKLIKLPEAIPGPPGRSGINAKPETAESILEKIKGKLSFNDLANIPTIFTNPRPVGGGYLREISDVEILAEPTHGQALVYDATKKKFVMGAAVGGGGGGEWGTITGDLEDQTDLWTILQTKVEQSDIDAAIDALIASSPGALDTLNELAAALGDDENFAATMTTALAGKSDVGHNHAGVYEPANANIQSHISNTSNPHSVTKAQVGLSSVENYAIASQAEAEAGTATNKYMTPERVAQAIAALSGGSPNWGSIGGTLADQTDLQAALDDKMDAGATQDDIPDGTNFKQYSSADKTKLAGIEASADVTDAANVGSSIHGASEKTEPVDADTVPLIDSAASNVLKKVTWANIKSVLNTYFATLFQPLDSDLTTIAGLSPSNDDVLQRKAGGWINRTIAQLKSDFGLTKADVGLGNVSNVDQIPLSYLDTDSSLAADSDAKVASQKAVKAYVDAIAQGLSVKAAVRVATTAAGTLASGFENGDTIDGVVLATGDRILIKDQAAPADNGIYVVNASGAPTRATDANVSAEVKAGMFVFVTEGTANADSGWVLTTNNPITLGTTGLTFTQFSGAGQITAGNALTKSGNTLDVAVDGSTIEISGDALRVKDAGITLAKMANMATASLIYRKTGGSGAPEVNSLATLKVDLGLTGTNSGDETATTIGVINAAAASKATPVNADSVVGVDSENSNVIKRFTFTNIKAFLKTYFDTLYQAAGAVDDTAYDATSWNGDTTHAPSKNAIRDKIESLGGGINRQEFTATGAGTWNKPASGSVARVRVWGAGGSGGKGQPGDEAGGGGGGGAMVEKWFLLSALGATEPVSVGTGGAGQTSTGTNGNTGGNSTFGASATLVTAYGGAGGGLGGSAAKHGGGGGGGMLGAGVIPSVADVGGLGGAPSGTNQGGVGGTADNPGGFNTLGGGGGGGGSGGSSTPGPGGHSTFGGGGGGGGENNSANTTGIGGSSIYGGAGGGGGGQGAAGAAGGTSINGGNGGAGSFGNTAATAGSQPGGGGGGSQNGTSGAGGNGMVEVVVF